MRILEDADGDGRYEKSTLFLDGLRHVTGLSCWKGGVFVASVPDIFHARDDDGDGRCDASRETCASCSTDCGVCSVCGNMRCETTGGFEDCVNLSLIHI